MQFGGHATTDTPQNGTCAFLDSGATTENQSFFWCRYNPGTSDSGDYQIIVGTGTTDTAGRPLTPEYASDSVMLGVTVGTATLSMEPVSVNERDGMATVTVTVDTAVTGGFSVDARTEDGTATAGEDYTAVTSQTLSFNGEAGDTQTFSVSIIDDTMLEGGPGTVETVTVLLGNLQIATNVDMTASTIISIEDNDYEVVLTMEDISVSENAGTATVSVSLDNRVPDAFSVVASTTDGTATAGEDYTVSGQTLFFNGKANQTLSFSVPIRDDSMPEFPETLTVSLGDLQVATPTGTGTLRPVTSATITIMDDDLGDDSINLNLIFPITFNGKTYVFLDQNGNGVADRGIDASPGDRVMHNALDRLLNDGNDTGDTQDGAHNGRDDQRSVIVDDSVLILPTAEEFRALRAARISAGDPPRPENWYNGFAQLESYWTSGLAIREENPDPEHHSHYSFGDDSVKQTLGVDNIDIHFVAFQVLPAPTILTFDAGIADQTYTRGQTVKLMLPQTTDGAAPLTYTLTRTDGGTPLLPTGLTFNEDARPRTISGMPSEEPFSAGLRYLATDATGAFVDVEFTLTVNAMPSFDTSTIPAPDSAYTYISGTAITPLSLPPATGGTTPLTYTLMPIPAGLTFEATATARTLSGTPTTATAAALTYTVTDINSVASSLTFMVTVNAIVPAAPTDVTLLPGNMRISVSWIPVPEANNGGAGITEYTATAIDTTDANNTFPCTATGAAATTCDISGLMNDKEYIVTVVATNIAGDSDKSTPVKATPMMFRL